MHIFAAISDILYAVWWCVRSPCSHQPEAVAHYGALPPAVPLDLVQHLLSGLLAAFTATLAALAATLAAVGEVTHVRRVTGCNASPVSRAGTRSGCMRCGWEGRQ